MYVYSYIGRKGIGERGREKKMGGMGGVWNIQRVTQGKHSKEKIICVYSYIL